MGENYEIITGKDIITIKPINSKAIIPSKTHLNFSQCESAIRKEFNSSILTLFQLEISNKNPKSLINQVEYGIFDENFEKIELNKCKDLNIEVIYGMKKDISSINYSEIIYYQNNNINIFNLSDAFFNDICHVYPDYENDIILEDRIKDIFLNYSVCEEGCIYKEFDNNYYTFTCECKIKNDINKENTEIKFGESHINSNNFEVLKCFNLVFSSEDKINNVGFWIFTFILGGHVPLLFHFINTGIKPIEDFVFNEMSEYGYIKKEKKAKDNFSIKIRRINGRKRTKKRRKTKLNEKVEKNEDDNSDENNSNNLEEEKNEEKEGKIKKKKEKDILNNKNNEKGNKKIKGKGNNNTSSPPPKNNSQKQINNTRENIKSKTKSVIIKNISKNISNNFAQNHKIQRFSSVRIKKKKKKTLKRTYSFFNKNTDGNNNDEENNDKLYKNKIGKNKWSKKSKKISKKMLKLNSTSENSNNLMKNSNKSLSSNFIQIKDFNFQFDDENEENENEKMGINLININVNNTKKKKYVPNDSNKILNNFTFEEALKHERRPFSKIFYIFLLSKQVIVHTFFYKSPLELISIRILVLIFILSSDLAFNAVFYFNSFISKKYRYTKGLFFFTFTNNIIIIFLSTFMGFIILILVTKLSNSTFEIREIFRKEEEKIKGDKTYKVNEERKSEIKKDVEEILKKLKNKNIILFIVEFIIILFYWYFTTAFCHVYSNTQVSWILDSFLTIIIDFIVKCCICLLFAELYKISIDSNTRSIYKFIMFNYNFI